jgi:hypothetical protein
MSLTLKTQFSEAAKNTQHKDTKRTKIKNNDYLNLSLCPPEADLPLARSFVVSWWLCV